MQNLLYNTMSFSDVWSSATSFVSDYNNNEINTTITDEEATLLYYLLYARFGNSPIANSDVNQFKYKVWSIIWQYGPIWSKKLDVQDKIRTLTDEEIQQGTLGIFNHAFNPEQAPGTTQETILNFINEQNTSKMKKSKLSAYLDLYNAIAEDVTEEFIARFYDLFKQFVSPEKRLLYVEDIDDES